jgi:hypothetical protein
VLAPQIDAFLGAVNDPESRERYLELKQAVARLEVPTELTERLGAVAEVGLTRGRVRSTFMRRGVEMHQHAAPPAARCRASSGSTALGGHL